ALHRRRARRARRWPERRGDRSAGPRGRDRGHRVGRRRLARRHRTAGARWRAGGRRPARAGWPAGYPRPRPAPRPPRGPPPRRGRSGWSHMTLARRIIPCLDVKDGRVVKGINFLQLRDAGDPVEQAAAYDAQGADEVCYLDISASPEGRSTLLDVVARTADQVFAPLTVGGGVRSVEDAERLLDAGADKIAINTPAIRNPDLVAAAAMRFGSQAIVVAVDARRVPGAAPVRWEVYSHGGRTPEGLDALAWCRRVAELGAGEILLTSMDRDGTGAG